MTDLPSAPDSVTPPPEVPSTPPRARWRVVRTAWEWAKSLSIALVLFVSIRSVLVEAFRIPSGSMESTLLVGDFLLVNKLVYGAEVPFLKKHLPAVREPRIGDIVVFQYPVDPRTNFVKRLVGVAGDTLEMRNGQLVRNGAPQVEPYVVHEAPGTDAVSSEFRWQREFLAPGVDARRYRPSRNDWGPLVVPAGHYFVLGDNRDNSLDSRYWGFVADTLVFGSPMVVYYSYAPDSARAFAWLTGVRWTRLGDIIR